MKKIIIKPSGIEELDLTAEEIALRQQDAIQAEQQKIADEQARQDALAKQQSAKTKLLNLGLTEEEIKALIGV